MYKRHDGIGLRAMPRIALIITLVGSIVSTVCAQPAEAYYHSRYFLFGFLLRSSTVCDGDWKERIDTAFNLVGSNEYRAFSQGYPKLVEKWSTEGGKEFNTVAMFSGVTAACDKAGKAEARARTMR
jgi:hypothetical protein